MQYNFTINNDKIVCNKNSTPYTGNINTYRCVFDITAKIDNLSWFCVFERENKAYVQPILNNECFIPHEVLTSEGTIKIGCYATNLNENDYKRISTNWVYFNSLEGAYSDASTPDVPEPDVWEELVLKSVPIIGENGNWYIYDISQEKYVDSGVRADVKSYAVKSERELIDSSNIRLYGVVNNQDVFEAPRPNTDSSEASETADIDMTTYDRFLDKDVFIYKDTIMRRDSNGRCSVLNPIRHKHIANKEYVDTVVSDAVGDIETALDNIIVIQNTLIGGDA